MSENDTTIITLPTTPQETGVLAVVAIVLILSALIYGALQMSETKAGAHRDWSTGALRKLFWILTPVWLAMLGLVLFHIWELLTTLPPALGDPDKMRMYALAFAGLVAALGALAALPLSMIRVLTIERQTRTAEQGHITDRIAKAVELIGTDKVVKVDSKETTEPNLEVRIGGLFMLERIAKDSLDDHIQVMEILCAYIRQNAKAQAVALPEGDDIAPEDWQKWRRETPDQHPRDDIAVALTVIQRRGVAQKQREAGTYRLDLRRAPLTRFMLEGVALENALLAAAALQGADLTGAALQGANLSRAELQGADLSGAKFDASTSLTAALLGAAAVRGVDFTDVNIEPEQIDAMFGDGSVTLPGGHGPEHESWPAHWPKEELKYSDFETRWRAWQREIGYDAEAV